MNLSLKIRKYNIRADLDKVLGSSVNENNNSYYFTCPVCHKQDKMYLHKGEKFFICFVCGIKGNFSSFLQLLYNISPQEARKKILGIEDIFTSYNEDLKLNIKELDDVGEIEDYKNFQIPAKMVDVLSLPKGHIAREYLEGRGIGEEPIKLFDLRYDHEWKRVVFPIYEMGQIIGYQARDITGMAEPKIISSKGLTKARVLYNYDNIACMEPECVTLTEGPVDCIKSRKYNSVALLGKYLSKYQLNLLLQIPSIKKLYVAIDPEEKEQRLKLVKELSFFWQTFLVPIEDGRDMGEYSEWEVDAAIASAVPAHELQEKIAI